jgi:ATP-binding cassette subfamily B protein
MAERISAAGTDGESVRDTVRRFWPYTRGDRGRLLLGAILAIFVTISEIGTVIVFDIITNKVLTEHRLAGFWPLAAAWLGIAVATAGVMFVGGYQSSLAQERFLLRLRDGVFAHAQRLSLDFFDRKRLGDLMVRLIDDLEVIEGLVCSGLVAAAAAAVSLLLLAAAAVVISSSLAVLAFAVAPLFWLVSRAFSGRLARAAGQEREASGSISSAVEESLSNQALVQAFNRQSYQALRLHEEGVSWLRARMGETRLNAIYAPVMYIVETLCVLIVFGAGAWEVAGGRVTLGAILSLAILLTFIYPEVQSLTGYRSTLAEGRASARRVTEILQRRPLVTDGTRAIRGRVRGRGLIDFESVSFAYPDADHLAIDRLTFSARPGQMLAITGPSGAGKSTVARLLLRFYDPDCGRILLDGIDIRELSLQTLRYNITLLQQESLLFAGTIRDNIGYAARGATDTQIHAAARAAGAHEFITALPDGYRTQLGERGRLLSGGQRQRIVLARAVLRDAPVLILDEPTTGLDPASARALMPLLGTAMVGRTIIVITHDHALAAAADSILHITGPVALTGSAGRARAQRAAADGNAARGRPGVAGMPTRPN